MIGPHQGETFSRSWSIYSRIISGLRSSLFVLSPADASVHAGQKDWSLKCTDEGFVLGAQCEGRFPRRSNPRDASLTPCLIDDERHLCQRGSGASGGVW